LASFVSLFFVQNVFEQQVVNPERVSTAHPDQAPKISTVNKQLAFDSNDFSTGVFPILPDNKERGIHDRGQQRKIKLLLNFVSKNNTIRRL
jgi:hypothetical protein